VFEYLMAPEQDKPTVEIVRIRPTPESAGPSRSTLMMPDGKQRIPLGSGIITSFLGEGGMANVYEIWNGQLEVFRAVKLINPNCSRDARERFQTEMKISAKLHHANITEIYGVGVWNGLPYIEMEKLDGITLDQLIRERGALPSYVCSSIGIMVGRALKYAHSQEYSIYGSTYTGVVHRDLKPSNIMICRNGTVKLMDFGIASPAEASFHTVAGTVLGTLQYLSPEQLEAKKLDVRSDVYSFGTTLYETLTGMMAFPEPGVHKLMLDKLKSRFRPLEDYELHVPRRLRRLIHRCMQHDRNRRMASANALLSELGRVHERLTTESPEQVMRRLLATPVSEKMVVATRVTWPYKVAAGLVIGAALVGTAWTVGERVARERQATAPARPAVVAAAPVPAPATRPAEPAVEAAVKRPAAPRTARTAAAPLPQPAAAPGKPLTLTERLQQKYETTDAVAVMVDEYKAGEYDNALAVFGELPEDVKATAQAQVYRVRALNAKGDAAGVRAALASTSVNDGELLLAKARLALESGNTGEAQGLLARAESAPRQFIDYEQLKREVSYLRAQCATRIFDQTPSEANYKAAVESWYEVRNQLRAQPNHEYNARAVSETQRIGVKYRESKG
jgi:hypothetical protein